MASTRPTLIARACLRFIAAARLRIGRKALISGLSTILLLFFSGPAAQAQTTIVNGLAGANGAHGGPNADGGDGSDALLTTAVGGATRASKTVTANGGQGGAGGNGGDPDGSGGDGGAGAEAVANASVLDGPNSSSATATANGGSGGAGGSAGSGGTGIGGDGGHGGDAHTRASSRLPAAFSTATARSNGGAGGNATGIGARAGNGGVGVAIAEATGPMGATTTTESRGGRGGLAFDGAVAGDGGHAILTSSSNTTENGSYESNLTVNQSAYGGQGGSGWSLGVIGIAGNGGDARTQYLNSTADSQLTRVTLESVGGAGGDGFVGGTGGAARSTGEVESTGEVRISVTSRAGAGGRSLGNGSGAAGASAEATARAVSSGGNSSATVVAAGGHGADAAGVGERAGNGGSAVAHATAASADLESRTFVSASSTGGIGGSSRDGARAGDGASAEMIDAVSGTGVNVRLSQIARGGAAGRVFTLGSTNDAGQEGHAGDATSTLRATNPIGALEIDVSAFGGSGEGSGSRAGAAFASGDATAAGDVVVLVTSSAGSSSAGQGTSAAVAAAHAEIGEARGTSTGGGDVFVRATLHAGDGVDAEFVGADGGDAVMLDVVDGDTTGEITLWQEAFGGEGGRGFAGGGSPVVHGRTGNAVNRLTRSKSAQRLSVVLASTGARADASGGEASVDGGSATSEANVHNDAGEVRAETSSTGGVGSNGGDEGVAAGAGGVARTVVRASSSGDGHAVIVGTQSDSVAEGGAGGGGHPNENVGGAGGSGFADAEGQAFGDSEVTVWATAIGGFGGYGGRRADGSAATSGAGGDAVAHARGSNAGTSSVSVLASAVAGSGGESQQQVNGGDAGTAVATAHGSSSGGGDVTVTARLRGGSATDGGRSTEAVLENAVSGTTTGRLRLIQEATGGGAVSRAEGAAGRSVLTWEDRDGGDLELVSDATGGDGVAGAGAHASVSGVGMQGVHVFARAAAGQHGFSAQPLPAATLGEVFGESLGGGHVIAEGEIVAVRGASTYTNAPTTAAGSGGDAILDNAVDGRTAGILELVQRARAGSAGSFNPGFAPGDAGNASSRVARSDSVAELRVGLEAYGGNGSSHSSTGSSPLVRLPASPGGSAEAESRVENHAGAIAVRARAEGGRGGSGSNGSQGGDGGRAAVHAEGTSSAGIGDVTIGGSGSWGAQGGEAAQLQPHNRPGPAGRGGDASSRSIGRSVFEGRVEVHDRAVGGDGASGGDASSWSEASNGGRLDVMSFANAIGGETKDELGVAGSAVADSMAASFSGSTTARAVASSDGRAVATARATSGMGLDLSSLESGALDLLVAEATADATGTEGRVEASASGVLETAAGDWLRVSGNASTTVHTQSDVAVRVGAGTNPSLIFAQDASVFIDATDDRAIGIATVGMGVNTFQESPDIMLRSEASISGLEVDSLEGLQVSFLSARISDTGFDALRFLIENQGERLVDRTFSTGAEAEVFFSTLLNLAEYAVGVAVSALDLRFVLELSGGSRFSSAGITFDITHNVVPEPGTTLLIGLGLGLLAYRRPASGRLDSK